MLIALALFAGVVLCLLLWWWLARRRRRAPAPATGPLPIVLVHGLFGFDRIALLGRTHPYFRGIDDALRATGAEVHVVRLPPMASVSARAERLATFVRALGAGRVNLVAHSMGGIDARYAISVLGLADRVGALVTIGTPHRGTPLANMGNTRPARVLRGVLERLGVAASATDWLTPERMAAFNDEVADAPAVYYASVVGRPHARQTSLPLRTSRALLDRRAGTSDGVVPCASQAWGEVILEADADHWAQIGWSSACDANEIYRAVAQHLRSRGL